MKDRLEKIVSSVKEVGRKSWKAVKDNAKILTLGTALAFGSVAYGSGNPGFLDIKNCLNSSESIINIVRDDVYYPGATDGYDVGMDGRSNNPPDGCSDIRSNIITDTLYTDVRAEDSNVPYNLELLFHGTPSDPNNKLNFSFPYKDYGVIFGDKPIIFASERLPYGSVVDVRRAIDKNCGDVPLIPLGTNPYPAPYDPNATLDIGTRLLADLNDDGKVDNKDFSILGEDWKEGFIQGQYISDIVGPNGIPDGFVDNYDLEALSQDWLKE